MKYVLNFIIAFTLLSTNSNSQNETSKPYISVLNFESVGLENSSKQLGAMIRLEVMKLDKYIVVEKH